MRYLPVTLVLGCIAPPVATTILPPRPAASPQMPPLIQSWLAAAESGTDCPMSVVEAREARAAAQKLHGDAAFVIGHTACMCDVVDAGVRLQYDGWCGTDSTPYAYELTTPDERRLLAWHNALVAKLRAGVTPEQLTRRTPLAAQLDELRATAATQGDPDSRNLRLLEGAVARVRSDVDGKFACLLEQDLITVKTHLENHERVELAGRTSKPGRALLAEAEALVQPLRGKMRACKLLSRDREYQQLEAQLESARRDLDVERTHSGYTRDQSDCYSERDASAPCRASGAVARIEARMRALERRYGLD